MDRFLIYYTLIGDGSRCREVHIITAEAEDGAQAQERADKWFGTGYMRILKVERLGPVYD